MTAAPDFLTTAVLVALDAAAGREKLDIWRETKRGPEFDQRALAALFTRTRMLDLAPPPPDSRAALAAHIVALMAHPLVPLRLYHEIGDFICDAGSALMGELEAAPAWIERVLAQGTCGYAACPGGGCDGRSHQKKGAVGRGAR